MGGESLLHPQFFEILQRLTACGLTVRLDSNAMLLGEAACRRLVTSGLAEIYLDLDGHDSESYELIRKRAKFHRVVNNIRMLLRIRAEMRSSLPKIIVKNIQYYEARKRPGVPESYKKLFAEYPPDEFRFAWADYWPGDHAEKVQNDECTYSLHPWVGRPQKCSLLWTRLAIGWDGTVLICCLDLNRTTSLGNVASLGVLGAWNSSQMIEFRHAHRQGRQEGIALCSTCNQIRRKPWKPTLFSWLSVSREGGQGGEYRD
jgi:hypothetical protein